MQCNNADAEMIEAMKAARRGDPGGKGQGGTAMSDN